MSIAEMLKTFVVSSQICGRIIRNYYHCQV